MDMFCGLSDKLKEIKEDALFVPLMEKSKREFEAELHTVPPSLTYSDFNLFFETGNRSCFEELYFKRRQRLKRAAILFLFGGEEKYKNELCNMIWQICSEISWVIPAHLNNIDVCEYRSHIDLFAAETGATLAEILYLMKDKLPGKIVDLINCELKARIFDAYEQKEFWWESLKSNWAAVCGGSVGTAYMYAAPERFEKVKDRLLMTLNSFLDGYMDDGCCIEGISYWRYGFGFYMIFADAYYHFTDGKCDLRHGRKIDEIAKYMQRVIMRKDIVVSFSDASRNYSVRNVGFAAYLSKNYEGVLISENLISENISLDKSFMLIRDLLWYEPDALKGDGQLKEGMIYFKDAQWYINKKKKYSFAAKAGHNNEEHNHNDVGSFIFADDSGQLLADLGAMEYTKANFEPETRYTLLQNSSLGHSVPIIDGAGQEYGSRYKGRVLNVCEDEFSLEMHEAYEGNIKSVVRTFRLNENGIIIHDSFSNSSGHSITERFVSVVKPNFTDEGVRIGNALLKTEHKAELSEQVLPGHGGKPINVYLIDYNNIKEQFVMEINSD